ncbi:ATP-binding protein [Paraglaciecola sp.]|uniref:ATP-binding protein n=1 Tax=Paraglaciecola sp. TaxID=1920173 RepID=UPI0030F3A4CE
MFKILLNKPVRWLLWGDKICVVCEKSIYIMIEAHNLLLAGVISTVLSCLLFLPIWYMNKELQGTQYWMGVLVLFAVQILSFVTQPEYLNTAWLIFQNGIGIATPLFILMGIRQFYGLPASNKMIVGIIALTLIGFSYCLLFEDININDDIKILVVRAEWTALLAMCIHTVVKQAKTCSFSDKFFIIICAVIALAMDYRALEIMLPGLKQSIPFPMYSLSLVLIMFLMPSGFLVSFTLLCMERRQQAINLLKQQAEQQTEHQRKLLLTLSHELRTPLNAIAGKGQLMKQGVNEPERLNDFDIIIKSAMNLADMTSQILDYSHLAASPLQVTAQPSELKSSIEGVIGEAISLIGNKPISIELALADTLPSSYLLDWTKVHRVLLNLVANGIKFTHSGTIVLSVSANTQNTLLTFAVSDTGIGIPTNDLPLLLDPFHRGSNVDNKIEGSGLGLAIVKELLTAMGSQLKVASQLGQGSRFYFSLAATPCAKSATLPEISTPTLTHLRILLVEDNSLNYEIMLAMLKQDKHQVTLAQTAKAALQLTLAQQFDVILLDMRLPDMHGTELYEQIRHANNSNRHTPFVVVTANITSAAMQQYALLDLNLVLSKPVEQNKLRQAIYTSQVNTTKALPDLPTMTDTLGEVSLCPIFEPHHLGWLKQNLQPQQFARYLQQLPDVFAQHLHKVQEALNNDDMDIFTTNLHKLSGSAAQLGLTRLAQNALALENTSLKNCQPEKIKTLASLCTLSISELQNQVEPS